MLTTSFHNEINIGLSLSGAKIIPVGLAASTIFIVMALSLTVPRTSVQLLSEFFGAEFSPLKIDSASASFNYSEKTSVYYLSLTYFLINTPYPPSTSQGSDANQYECWGLKYNNGI
ncbi:hypothetical protein ABN225_05650 [Providencia alcalifaciens]